MAIVRVPLFPPERGELPQRVSNATLAVRVAPHESVMSACARTARHEPR